MGAPGVRLILPGNVRHNSGGNAYNAALLRALQDLGVTAESCGADGGWPVGSAADRQRFSQLLTGSDGGQVTLVDGLVALGAPAELEAAAAAGTPAWILLHMPLEGHAELEHRALDAAAGVICTSNFAAAALRDRHALVTPHEGAGRARAAKICVALPGTEPAPAATGSHPPHLLAVAALLPNKDQLLLVRALAGLTDLPWTATLAGSDTAEPRYSARLRQETERLGLHGRVSLPGELRGPALETEWAAADLSLLISQAETYGLVVTESLAHGIPVVVRQGTGAVEALAAGTPAGTALPGAVVALSDDPAPLTALLRRWLTEPTLRERWRTAALTARDHLPGWDATARAVLAALGDAGPVD